MVPRYKVSVHLGGRYGLHARAAAKAVRATHGLDADVAMEYEGNRVDGRSIMGIMTLSVASGAEFEIFCEGPQAAQAVENLRRLFAQDDEFAGTRFLVVEPPESPPAN
jgi:phosphocarrier protein HPr